jgi:choline dehydrogenase
MAPEEYEVIIVGSGSSGGALAARLTEDGERSVLVLEAGPIYRSVDQLPAAVRDPADMSNALPGAANNWSLFGSLTDEIQVPVPRGKGLGGSSSINGAYFIRGLPANFEEWVELGNDEWAFEKVLPFYKRLESEKDFPEHDMHGTSGPIPVRREPADRAPEFTEAFTQACLDLGYPHEPDKNAPGAGGVGPVPLNVDGGHRVGTAIAYLIPSMRRSNLKVLGDATVHRVLFDGTKCIGVEAHVGGGVKKFYAGEVVLSAGALRTPQLLMLSGIGPASHLREKGIEVRVDLAGVGQNLTDHPELSVPWNYRGRHRTMPGRGVMTSALHWTAEGSEQPSDLEILPFVATPAQMMHLSGTLRRPMATLKMMRDTSTRFVIAQARTVRLPFIVIGLQQEDSRGTVTLASSNPDDPPVLNWNLFAEENDVRRFREAVKVTAQIFSSAHMTKIHAKLVGLDREQLARNEELDAWMRSHIFAVGHPSSTCRMGPASDPTAVVDQYGRVYGIENLRVCDQSVFPKIPSRGPNATAIMIGERMSEFFEQRPRSQLGAIDGSAPG